jgi:hypothetical protein
MLVKFQLPTNYSLSLLYDRIFLEQLKCAYSASKVNSWFYVQDVSITMHSISTLYGVNVVMIDELKGIWKDVVLV